MWVRQDFMMSTSKSVSFCLKVKCLLPLPSQCTFIVVPSFIHYTCLLTRQKESTRTTVVEAVNHRNTLFQLQSIISQQCKLVYINLQ